MQYTLYDNAFFIRPLISSDRAAYQALRRKILKIGDGKYYSDSYVRESLLTQKEWLEWCTETPHHCIIGTFHKDALIGTMMITEQTLLGSPIVEWEATWLDPQYRGKGIASLAYEEVRNWTKLHGYEFAIVFIRENNICSQQIRLRQGFAYLGTVHNERWADGSIADSNSFILDLYANSETSLRKSCSVRKIYELLIHKTERAKHNRSGYNYPGSIFFHSAA